MLRFSRLMVISLPVRQKCYFGYGATRPRRGERSQCAAFEANKKAKGWRTAEALHEAVATICGESQAGRQRALEILARRFRIFQSLEELFDPRAHSTHAPPTAARQAGPPRRVIRGMAVAVAHG